MLGIATGHELTTLVVKKLDFMMEDRDDNKRLLRSMIQSSNAPDGSGRNLVYSKACRIGITADSITQPECSSLVNILGRIAGLLFPVQQTPADQDVQCLHLRKIKLLR